MLYLALTTRSRRALLWAALGVCSACSSARSEDARFEPPPAQASHEPGGVRLRPESRMFVDVAAIGGGDTPALVRSPGRVAFRDAAVSRVSAPVNGRVTAVYVHVGQHVQRGERLLALASPDAAAVSADFERAQVDERAANAELKRQQLMAAHGVGIESELAAARARWDEARAELARARSSAAILGRSEHGAVEVRAPIEGDVLALHASLGAAARSDGDSLLELGDAADLWVVTEVFERELPLIKSGDSATAELASVAAPVPLRVVGVGAAVDPETRRAPVYLSVDGQNPQLRAGMYARVTIEASDQRSLGVPAAAVLVKDGGKTIVYVTKDGTSFLPREVSVGHPVDGRVPVFAGVQPGDRIAVRGALLLDSSAEQLL
ncbi:MAG TPA: efflux RND transporter periplasmic adaptor subunit [Polyangiales bacterium]|nr:efflux RND transporter periplasmic adaptor subunit [Polyangiales bacterium]